MSRTTAQLEHDLHAGTGAGLDPKRLAAIRDAGRGRRRRQRALGVAGAAAAVLLAGGVPMLVVGVGPQGSGPSPSNVPSVEPSESPTGPDDGPEVPADVAALQERVLAEIPGARRVSRWQVEIPDPRQGSPGVGSLPGRDAPGRGELRGQLLDLDVPAFGSVDTFPSDFFPAWLRDGWRRLLDRAERQDGQAQRFLPEMIRVVAGDLSLGCARVAPASEICDPTLYRRSGLREPLGWRFGEDSVRLDVEWVGEYTSPTSVAGAAPELAMVGVRRIQVSSAVFINTAGEDIAAQVDRDVIPGVSLMWAAVPGDPVEMVGYDDSGAVVFQRVLE